MHQIIYGSRAVRRLRESELVSLCEVAIARNGTLGVTGLLLHDGRRFLQALEGPEEAVRWVMSLIEGDPLHRDIVYMADRPVIDREFGAWSMKVKSMRPHQTPEDFLDIVKEDVGNVRDPALRAAFIGFALLSRDAGSDAYRDI